MKSLQGSKAVPDQQQVIWALMKLFAPKLITLTITDVTEEPWNREDPCENMIQAQSLLKNVNFSKWEWKKKCFLNGRSRIMQQKGPMFSLSAGVKLMCSSLAQPFHIPEHFTGKTQI